MDLFHPTCWRSRLKAGLSLFLVLAPFMLAYADYFIIPWQDAGQTSGAVVEQPRQRLVVARAPPGSYLVDLDDGGTVSARNSVLQWFEPGRLVVVQSERTAILRFHRHRVIGTVNGN